MTIINQADLKPLVFLIILSIGLVSCQSVEKKAVTELHTPLVSKFVIGTYTKSEGHVEGKGDGIYVATIHYDNDTSFIRFEDTIRNVINPSYVALSPDRRTLYAVNETGPDVDSVGSTSAFAFDHNKTGAPLTVQSSHSFAPCYITTDPESKLLFTTNYVGGVVVVNPIIEGGGHAEASQVVTLYGRGPHPRQEASHPHSIMISRDGQFAYVPDLGTDRIMIYRIDYDNGHLVDEGYAEVPAGAGPRHISFHPDAPLAYVINELDGTIAGFRVDTVSGALAPLSLVTTLPPDFSENNQCADIHITPDGKFLYGSNRGHNSIVGYAINTESGSLTLISHTSTAGDWPRNFMITNDGRHLLVANQDSDNIVLFRIENEGELTQLADFHVPTPVCLVEI